MPVTVERDVFGTTASGHQVHRFTFKNQQNVSVQILDYGGIITSVSVPDRTGKVADITTGFSTLAEYEANPAYFGALIGRYANRINAGKFMLDDQKYFLATNNGPNHLHGGKLGFDKKLWTSHVDGTKLKLSYRSADKEEGYPGTLGVEVTYELTEDNDLHIGFTAMAEDRPTIVNLTNHAYFNLAGHKSKSIADHLLTVNADMYLEKDVNDCPNGNLLSVEGTLFDLRIPTLLGDRVDMIDGTRPGYDHNFCLKSAGDDNDIAARLEHPASGRCLEVYTDQPGLQVYTGNWLGGIAGKHGAVYDNHAAIALEAQNYPDAINHANFPSCILRPGETYRHNTTYKFITKI